MKNYQNPEIEVLFFENEDVVTTSSIGALTETDHSASTEWTWEL